MSESKEIKVIHPKITKLIKEVNKVTPVWYDKPVKMGFGVKGQPDFLILIRGMLFGVEAKWDLILNSGKVTTAKNKLPNRNQVTKLRQIKASGGFGLIVDKNNFDAFENLFRGASNHNNRTDHSYIQKYIERSNLDVENYASHYPLKKEN